MGGIEHGCLLLADISGYTRYLTGVELEHSTDVLADLLGVVVDQMKGGFRLAKLEGDAVFSYATDDGHDGGLLVTTIEGTYFAFAKRLRDIAHATTCTCRACSRIPDLGLKFLVHHGEYALHDVAGHRELVGKDVILAHRLLKNSITKRTGLNGYALVTAACAEHFGLDPVALGWIPHVERFSGVGEVRGWVIDLDTRWREEEKRSEVYVPAEGAFVAVEAEAEATPMVAWRYTTAPDKQVLWMSEEVRQVHPKGIPGVGSTNHCVHGKAVLAHEVVDWKPFRYLTERIRGPFGEFLMTAEIVEVSAGRVRLSHRMGPVAGSTMQRLMAKAMRRKLQAGSEEGIRKLAELLTACEIAPLEPDAVVRTRATKARASGARSRRPASGRRRAAARGTRSRSRRAERSS
jgi:hypothetical protein